MCGIAGVLMFDKKREGYELEYIRELVKQLAIQNQMRGDHATGFAVANKGNNNNAIKMPMSATKFVKQKIVKKWLQREITNDTHSVLVHTRWATQGSIHDNVNNHPIVTDKFIGVHNGMIDNDEELFLTEGLARAGKVDSEVIFRLLDKNIGDSKNLKVDAIKKTAEALQGMFTIAFFNQNDNQKLYLVKNDNPVTLAYLPNLNIIVFASLAYYITDAIREANKIAGIDNDAYVFHTSIEWRTPTPQSIFRFDMSVNTPLNQLTQRVSKFTENINRSWFRGRGSVNQYGAYQRDNSLFAGWGQNGWEEDGGYSAEEIEEWRTKYAQRRAEKFAQKAGIKI